MAEWFKAAVLKTAVLGRVPGVRIPLPPPVNIFIINNLQDNTKSSVPENLAGASFPLPVADLDFQSKARDPPS
jgi:hypothetical protein